MRQVSLMAFGSFEELPGHQPTIAQGYQKIPLRLAETIPREAFIMNTPVVKISIGDSVLIETDKGSQRKFDAVIVTLPLAYLKRHAKKLFARGLPQWKMKALQRLEMGVVDKIFLEFENLDFFPEGVRHLFIARSPPSENWTSKLYSFSVQPNYTLIGASVILYSCRIPIVFLPAWITGKAAEKMETLSKEEVIQGCVDLLKMVLCKDIPQPTKLTRYGDWLLRSQNNCGLFQNILGIKPLCFGSVHLYSNWRISC
jgi:spermine oxidase